MITELCPNCGVEVDIKEGCIKQNCPNCGKRILPCSLCNMDEVNCKDCLGKKVQE